MCNWVNKSGVVTIVLFVFCVVFFSCEEISFGKDQDTAEMLCNRVWVDFYDEDDYTGISTKNQDAYVHFRR